MQPPSPRSPPVQPARRRQKAAKAPSETPQAAPPAHSNWHKDLLVLQRRGIPESQREWYVRRMEAFVAAMRPLRIGEVSAEQITAFFPRYAREHQLNAWQFRQLVDSVQLLLVDPVGSPQAREVDWDYWREAGRSIRPGHSRLTRERTPEEVVSDTPRFGKAAESHELLKTLVRTLRANRYAIGTEEAYLDWCNRFLIFCGGRDPQQLTQADVEGFLAHLAADRNASASTQRQALNASVFLFRCVLERPLGGHRDCPVRVRQ